jgi:regulatory protein YycH of two-component signal transduction system YycFG
MEETTKVMTDLDQSFTTSITVDKTPHEVFEAVTNVRGWWSQTITGDTAQQGDEFEFEVKGVHYSKQQLVEVIPDKRVVWLVTEANMTFIPDHGEWKGTEVIFDITADGDKTTLTFTHVGLVPAIACYGACMPAWTQYIEHSLKQLIETGIGDPNLEGRTISKPE